MVIYQTLVESVENVLRLGDLIQFLLRDLFIELSCIAQLVRQLELVRDDHVIAAELFDLC